MDFIGNDVKRNIVRNQAPTGNANFAVMNAGRIEQVDAPHLLYTRPCTRFVASFIGRTNLVAATRLAGTVRGDGFSLPASIPDLPAAIGADMLLSIRPQSIRLHTVSSPTHIAARIESRVFLGETWDYVVTPIGGGAKLRVAAPPTQVLEAGAPVWLEFDPAQIVVVT